MSVAARAQLKKFLAEAAKQIILRTPCWHPVGPCEETPCEAVKAIIDAASATLNGSRKATHEISACYFPGKGDVELTWRDLSTGQCADLTTKVTAAEGLAIAEVVMPCVYSPAVAAARKK